VSSGSGQRSRPYRMRRRIEHIDATRLRIVEAAVALHGTVGPSGTTVMGIAEHAGVTRATVYRHFRDDAALFAACSTHWLAQQVPPNPSSWMTVADPFERIRSGLGDLYRFYRAGESMLTRIHRDKRWLPADVAQDLDVRDEQIRELLLSPLARPGTEHSRLRAVIGHAIGFWTWRSLCIDQRLTNQEAVELMVDLATTAAAHDGRSD
jgi:AcrR family transcriptional regulator